MHVFDEHFEVGHRSQWHGIDPVLNTAQFAAACQTLVNEGQINQNVANAAEVFFGDVWGGVPGGVNVDAFQVTAPDTLSFDVRGAVWHDAESVGPNSGVGNIFSEAAYQFATGTSGCPQGEINAANLIESDVWGNNLSLGAEVSNSAHIVLSTVVHGPALYFNYSIWPN